MVGMLPGIQPWSRMSIARKEFRAIAHAIGRSELVALDKAHIADVLCEALIELNPNFDPERFFVAATGFPRALWHESRDFRQTLQTEGDKNHG